MRCEIATDHRGAPLKVVHLAGKLCGRLAGRQHFARTCEALSHTSPGDRVGLDFSEAEQLSASWLNSMLVPFLRWAAAGANDVFPILLAVNPLWHDEFRLVAEWNHQCYVLAPRALPNLRHALLIGSLDPGQYECLTAVLAHPEATGANLKRWYPDVPIGATAWNNRLRELYAKRLLIRHKRGREWRYTGAVTEIDFYG